jgi:hypothetical protein
MPRLITSLAVLGLLGWTVGCYSTHGHTHGRCDCEEPGPVPADGAVIAPAPVPPAPGGPAPEAIKPLPQ